MSQERIFRGSPHYYERVKGEKMGTRPVDFLSLNLPPRCNYRCGFCFSGMNSRQRFRDQLSQSEMRDIIRDAARFGIRHIEISGEGEPLVFLDSVRGIIQIAEEYGVHTCIFTNGFLLCPEVSQELAERDVSVAVSLETCDAEQYESFVKRRGAFEAVMLNISGLREAFRHRIRQESGFTVLSTAIHSIVMADSVGQIENIRAVAGAEIFLSLAPFIVQGDGVEMDRHSSQIVSPEIYEDINARYGDGSLILSESARETHGTPICGTFLYGLGFRHNGDALFDAHAYSTAGILGNIRSSTLKDLIQNVRRAKDTYFRLYDDGGFCPLRNPNFQNFIREQFSQISI